jgi:uncharacterized protein YbcI
MNGPRPTRARQIARAASAFEREATGRPPESVAVALAGDTLVVTLHGALSPAEQALGRTQAGASLLQEFHRGVFASAGGPLRQEVARVTGVEVREATAEVQAATGTLALVFALAGSVPPEAWSGPAPGA